MMAGAQAVHVFEPEGTGDERILVSSGVAAADSIRDLVQQSMALAMQLFPALQPTGTPSFFQVGGEQAAEVSYTGMSAAGVSVSGWQGVILKDRFYFAVMGLARTDRTTPIQKEARFMLRSMRPGHIEENRQLAAAIVGRWTFYQGSSSGGGSSRTSSSVTKQVTFYPNGRFEYQGGVYVDTNMPGGGGGTASGDNSSTGTYKVYGNTLYSQIDGGGQAVFGLELVKGGGLKIDGTLFIRE
jgi:hypothetical protein